ncbi:MAG: hydratase, partial [Oxalobacteraceae bacterium]|nr:hydratase [Oxalobacteraceae bacterium]
FGRNVLGDPRVALAWLVNELSKLGISCEPGQVVTTGTCRIPVTVKPGDTVEADFGLLGRVGCRFV